MVKKYHGVFIVAKSEKSETLGEIVETGLLAWLEEAVKGEENTEGGVEVKRRIWREPLAKRRQPTIFFFLTFRSNASFLSFSFFLSLSLSLSLSFSLMSFSFLDYARLLYLVSISLLFVLSWVWILSTEHQLEQFRRLRDIREIRQIILQKEKHY